MAPAASVPDSVHVRFPAPTSTSAVCVNVLLPLIAPDVTNVAAPKALVPFDKSATLSTTYVTPSVITI